MCMVMSCISINKMNVDNANALICVLPLLWEKLAFVIFKKTIRHFDFFPKLIKEIPLF